MTGHLSQHGALLVSSAPGGRIDCGHSPRKGASMLVYEIGNVCLRCAVAVWCPVCSTAGRNVCLDDPAPASWGCER